MKSKSKPTPAMTVDEFVSRALTKRGGFRGLCPGMTRAAIEAVEGRSLGEEDPHGHCSLHEVINEADGEDGPYQRETEEITFHFDKGALTGASYYLNLNDEQLPKKILAALKQALKKDHGAPKKDPDFDRNFVVWTICDDPPIKLGASTWKAESPSPDDFRDQHVLQLNLAPG